MLDTIHFPLSPEEVSRRRAEFERDIALLDSITTNSAAIPAGHEAPLTQDCPSSPIRFCVYDPDSDMSYDECIYCGEPEERK